jgi:Protein of unknown function (DUF732)
MEIAAILLMFIFFLKIPPSVAVLGIALVSTALFPPWLAAQEFAQDRLGICPLSNLSGYSAIDIEGNLVNLIAHCQGVSNTSELRHNAFWDSFVKTADDEAIAYANTSGRVEVTAYGNTICPFLQNGGTLAELRQVQSDQSFPPTFEVAVTKAAIQTYCPTHQAEIGQ